MKKLSITALTLCIISASSLSFADKKNTLMCVGKSLYIHPDDKITCYMTKKQEMMTNLMKMSKSGWEISAMLYDDRKDKSIFYLQQ